MPRTVRLVFGVHSHQPIGNFDDVIARALESAYDPFLAVLERHPAIRVVLHYSGCLLEWMEANAPRHLDRLAALARGGRVEILTGGFYEPILPLIPRGDAVGQIRLQSRYIEERFGAAPKGMWLAERVWEPSLPGTLREAGVRYTLLDDFHFLTSMDGDPVGGYYITEDQGAMVRLFPISERLRYLIPFREASETIEWLRSLGERAAGDPVAVIVDDGEKFGLWPGTHDWVHGSEGRTGWLESFFTALEENASWLRTSTLSEVAGAIEPRGRVYLPPGSYMEMGEWSLPVARGRAFAGAVARARSRETWEEERPFLRGGYFRSFQSRYSESLLMVRRAQTISRMLDLQDPQQASADRQGRPSPARRELWRAMCNCSYWHGIFGGLYLPHIRRAVGTHLCRARRLLEETAGGARTTARAIDIDADGHDEIELRTAQYELLIDPAVGGAITVWDVVGKDYPLGLTLTRRLEQYHHEMLSPSAAAGSSDHGSIHEMAVEATPEMKRLVVADDGRRASAVDRFLDPAATVEELAGGTSGDLGDFHGGRYEAALLDDGPAGAVLTRAGTVAGRALAVSKTFRAGSTPGAIEMAWRLEPPPPAGSALFAVELNLALVESMGRVVLEPAGQARTLPLSGTWSSEPAGHLKVEDDYAGFALDFQVEPQAAVWHHPVRTVSRSEKEYEAIYQGSALLFVWGGAAPVPREASIRIEIQSHHRR